jgi:hypothetical protein
VCGGDRLGLVPVGAQIIGTLDDQSADVVWTAVHRLAARGSDRRRWCCGARRIASYPQLEAPGELCDVILRFLAGAARARASA